jgi:hypothetical protein
MHVPSPEAVRAQPTVHSARKLSLALLALAASSGLAVAPSAHAAKAPKLLKKTTIVAPKATSVKGTLSGTKCYVRFPATTKSVQITVTGPLSAKKPKTHKLKVKGTKKAKCTWATKSYADGKYRFTVKAKVRASGKWWNVSLKRAVVVANRVTSSASGTSTPQLGVGNTRYVGRLESQWDGWLTDQGKTQSTFMKQHMWEVVAHPSFFDDKLSWAPPALAYKDLYAIYRGDADTVNAHPDWILKDASGQPTYISWGCNPGPCPQYAGDIGSPAFRQAWIDNARTLINKGYTGLWIDDANVEMRVANAAGTTILPIDPRTKKTMTFANWRRYVAEFLEEIRAQLPQAQLVANVLWFGGTSIGRDSDPYVLRAYTTVNRLNLERGFNDDGLTAGTAPGDVWSVDSFMRFIDRMHDRGIPVTLDSAAGPNKPAWEYNLAGYFMVDRGQDAVGELGLKPGDWWNGWDIKLGAPTSGRSRGSDGVFRRTFASGLVLLNPTRAKTVKVKLPTAMKRIDGTTVTSVTLGGGRGAVLRTK